MCLHWLHILTTDLPCPATLVPDPALPVPSVSREQRRHGWSHHVLATSGADPAGVPVVFGFHANFQEGDVNMSYTGNSPEVCEMF